MSRWAEVHIKQLLAEVKELRQRVEALETKEKPFLPVAPNLDKRTREYRDSVR